MGKPTGFLEYKRVEIKKDPVPERVKHFKEFEKSYDDATAEIQGARCMDCGIPFCHGDTGCPVDNLIPEWNDLVYRQKWKEAIENLHSTNNFPEFTGRLCPAPCESACVLGINDDPVSIKAIERTIIDKAWENGWVKPKPAAKKQGYSVAVVGSGPAGLACAQQLARAGYSVTVYEKNDRVGGLLRYGIPDFKMEKDKIDRRVEQMKAEGVKFVVNTNVGVDLPVEELLEKYDAIALAGGSEQPRDLPVPGRDLEGIYFAMQYLTQSNRVVAGDKVPNQIHAKNKHVVVIGGGDTGSDCVGTANRQGAKSVTQIELFPKPPEERPPHTPWPYWPAKLRTSSSHEEGCERLWSISTKEFLDNGKGHVRAIRAVKNKLENGKIIELPETEFELKADLVLLAMGFLHPVHNGLITELKKHGLELDDRGNVKASFGIEEGDHQTSIEKVFACGDMRRGQSLIVWAISEGRKCAIAIHRYLQKKKKVYSKQN
ncbi:MAG: glutamate synthase subunit beta [Candidatus Hydrogenedentota bacterium]|nr:MAG: glutamate synthase subunit beta [Candidatus Hydrogenedentota bacterium]